MADTTPTAGDKTPDTDVTGDSSPEQDVSAAPQDESSSSGETDETLMDAVSAALDTPGEDTAESEASSAEDTPDNVEDEPAEQAETTAEEPEDDTAPPEEPDEAELASFSTKAQKRFRQLVKQAKDARAEAEEARAVAEKAAPIVDYMAEHDIPQEDVDVLLGLAARLRKGDFNGFLEAVQPYIELAQRFTGVRLPEDLQQQVIRGDITPAAATEVARARASTVWQEHEARQREQAQQRQVAEHQAASIHTAIQSWETQVRQRDPDYDRKSGLVRRISQAIIQEQGPPRDAQQAVQYAQSAYDEATAQITDLRPAPRATARTPSSTDQSVATAPKGDPKSLMDAVNMALGE